MKTIQTNNKLKTFQIAQVIAKRSKITIPNMDDIIQIDENKFKIELDLENIDHLPIGLKKYVI